MPAISPETSHQTPNNFSFSGASLDFLEEVGTSEYTLATIAVDVSGSTHLFADAMEAGLAACFAAWRKHPRSGYMLVRLITFDETVTEVHGFRLVKDCPPDEYKGILHPNGRTALYEATVNAISSTASYAALLTGRHFLVNAITVVITDGFDNASKHKLSDIKAALEDLMRSETVESHTALLFGVNVNETQARAMLAKMETRAGFDHYLEVHNADPSSVANMCDFIMKSTSSASQSIGTGAAPAIQPLTF